MLSFLILSNGYPIELIHLILIYYCWPIGCFQIFASIRNVAKKKKLLLGYVCEYSCGANTCIQHLPLCLSCPLI